ncbi:MAG: hypothetical protein AAF378_19030 [Cyanobacteria bacterium P01_A01_bin.84]
MTQTIEEALAIAKQQAKINDDYQDALLTSFLEQGAAKCDDGTITYRPFMAAAFAIYTTQYSQIMSDRYRLGLISADNATWISPLEGLKEYMVGLLRIQSAMDCNHKDCIPECWSADKLIDDINCGCEKKTENTANYCFSATVI